MSQPSFCPSICEAMIHNSDCVIGKFNIICFKLNTMATHHDLEDVMTSLEIIDQGQGHIITNMTFNDQIKKFLRNYSTDFWTVIVIYVKKIACVHGN